MMRACKADVQDAMLEVSEDDVWPHGIGIWVMRRSMPPAACVVEGAAGSVGELTALLSYVFGAVILAATINVVAGIVTS